MKKEKIKLDNLILVGISTRTNNKNEMDPKSAKIAPLAHSYWSKQIANSIKNRINPGVTYSIYTDYESDEHGEYTYFIGEEVKSLENQVIINFNSLIIPASNYQKFTTNAGKFPDIVIAAWQRIWQMTPADLGGKRQYKADFEMYDQRASNPDHSIVDIYIGIGEG